MITVMSTRTSAIPAIATNVYKVFKDVTLEYTVDQNEGKLFD